MTVARLGVAVQAGGVAAGFAAIASIASIAPPSPFASSQSLMAFAALLLSGVAAGVGASVMRIVVVHDWAPEVISGGACSRFNVLLKRVDLVTEFVMPGITGIIVALSPSLVLAIGIVAAWNALSFVPEYLLLRRVYDASPMLASMRASKVETSDPGPAPFASLRKGLAALRVERAAPVIVASALMSLAVLSPHGVLLTAWLKTEWSTPEVALGIFRGLCAVFGLAATVVFPALRRRVGLVPATRLLTFAQTGCIVAAAVAFSFGPSMVYVFMALVLLSRVGRYGFTLGETEIRQLTVEPSRRGVVNGVAAAITGLCSTAALAVACAVPGTASFPWLVLLTACSIGVAAGVFARWACDAGLREGSRERSLDGPDAAPEEQISA